MKAKYRRDLTIEWLVLKMWSAIFQKVHTGSMCLIVRCVRFGVHLTHMCTACDIKDVHRATRSVDVQPWLGGRNAHTPEVVNSNESALALLLQRKHILPRHVGGLVPNTWRTWVVAQEVLRQVLDVSMRLCGWARKSTVSWAFLFRHFTHCVGWTWISWQLDDKLKLQMSVFWQHYGVTWIHECSDSNRDENARNFVVCSHI